MLLCGLIAIQGASAFAEDVREWMILEAKEYGKPLIVRALSTVPDQSKRNLMPWRLTVEWRYESTKEGLPTEGAIQKARVIEDDIDKLLQSQSPADLPLVETGNGVRRWYFYVRDPKAVEKAMQVYFDKRPEIIVSVKARKDQDWSALKEVVLNAPR